VFIQKNSLHFLHGALDAAFSLGKPWLHSQCAPKHATDIMEGGFVVPWSSFFPPPPESFSADALVYIYYIFIQFLDRVINDSNTEGSLSISLSTTIQ